MQLERLKQKKVIKTILLISIILISTITLTTVLIRKITREEDNQLIDSEPITISEDLDFEKLNISGEGTPENPYLIENLRFSNHNTGISIKKTTVHFTITNCEFLYNSAGIRIVLVNEGRGNITKNTFSGSSRSGLEIYYSTYLVVAENQFYNDGMYFNVNGFQGQKIILKDNKINGKKIGFFVARKNLVFQDTHEYGQLIFNSCSNLTFEGINIDDTSNGIQIYQCQNITIMNSNFKGNNMGIRTEFSSDIRIVDCSFRENDHPTILTNGENYTLERNYFFNNTDSAGLIGSEKNVIHNNTFSFSHKDGLSVYHSSYSEILFNNFSWNSLEGLHIYGESSDNFIHHNIFQYNTPNAASYGQNNIWFDALNDHGNWWSDYLGDDAYLIPGSENAYDLFPLQLSELFNY